MNSRKPGSQMPRHLRGELVFSARTPGTLGINDAGDPSRLSLLGDTPGSLGINDHGSPARLTLPGLRTFHAWLDEASVHLPPQMQAAHYWPAGRREDVIAEASKFILRWESVQTFAYVPGAESGITIGAGYDIGQTTEKEFRTDWADLAKLSVIPARYNLGVFPQPEPMPSATLGMKADLRAGSPEPARMFPFQSALFTPLDRLAFACAGKLSHSKALEYLKEVQDIAIPEQLSMRVFEDCSLPKGYSGMVRAMPGVIELPTGVQVALLSLVYNRGTGTKHGSPVNDDIFDSRWEMRELTRAVMFKDLVWIYWHFESMRRLWASKTDQTSVGLVKRRDAELALIYPYVASDLHHEAFMQSHPLWK
ncbi:MAG: lysozyme family protein [Steroidobacteraceae bacterium]